MLRQLWRDWRSGVRTTDTPYGRIAYFKHDEWHGRSLAKYGEWSESEVALWRQLGLEGSRVIDVGAHIGAHTLALRNIVGPLGQVDAYEPQPKVADLLRRNVAAFENVRVHEVALGDGFNSVMMFNEPDYRKPGNFGGVELFTFSATMGQAVICRKLDELGSYKVRFVKIDVEGMEREVLMGMDETIRRDRPILYVEADRPKKAGALLTHLWSRGYNTRWHIAPIFNPRNFRREKKNVFGDTCSVNLLALPRPIARIVWPNDPYLYRMDQIRLTPEGVLRLT